MLAKSKLRDLISAGDLGKGDGISIVPTPSGFSEDQIGAASLDVRLGRWFLTFRQTKRSEIDLSQAQTSSESVGGEYHYVRFDDKFTIHPGRFVLASTLEWIRLPTNIGAYITGRSALGRRGLIIETAAGIHPGFAGCLTLEISNCGEIPISVSPGMRIAQLFFHSVEGNPEPYPSQFNGSRRPTVGSFVKDIVLHK